ncbi:hypothetical protein ACH4T9_12660 [Micromonospora sp. NPDC020750]|uniref:hypothetical protein n=1 Tax=unclassified Micromonospora TaxID=2617518 RepID=UPI0037909FAD
MGAQNRLDWISRGSPFRLMQPARDLRDGLRRHGYTVYDIGNRSHLEHNPPEDHTPYSATGYPGRAQYGVGYAVDIMPPPSGARSKVDGLPLPSLQQLGAQLLADRNARVTGIQWLKYMNWEPERNGAGPCYQELWKPTYSRRTSTDRGHIHLSGLTGHETSSTAAGYDPVARIRGEDEMANFTDTHARVLDQLAAVLPTLAAQSAYTDGRIEAIASGRPTVRADLKGGGQAVWLVQMLRSLPALLGSEGTSSAELAAALAALPDPVDVDEPAIIAGVLAGLSPQRLAEALRAAGLTPEAIAAAVPADMARQVVDELTARLNAGPAAQS